MNYIKHKIKKNGIILIREEDDDGKVWASNIKPNQPIEKYNEQIEADPDFAKYRTQENADAHEAKLQAIKPSKKELPEQEKARKEKEKREQALERLIQKEMKAMEKEK